MLEVQKYLKSGKKFEDLTVELGIHITKHESKPLVILNYDQIESKKNDPIVRECRGLVLHSETFEIVARSFNRFFNWGEVQDEMKLFDFSNFIIDSKEDGSLVLIYQFEGNIHFNTRGSFAQGELEGFDGTWEEAIKSALTTENLAQISLMLYDNPRLTIVCEFCSLYNKVVRAYNTPTLYVLGAFDNSLENEIEGFVNNEYPWNNVDKLASCLKMNRPNRYEFRSIEQVEKFINENSEKDSTFEGVVIRDINGNRWKCKSSTYLALHRMGGNGNCFLPKNLIPFVLSGESAELLSVFKEVEPKYREVEAKINGAFEDLKKTFLESKEIEDQKTFALSIKNKTPFTGILFTLKKKFGKNAIEKDLKEIWRQSADSILKVLFD